jgi:hypothetical protein
MAASVDSHVSERRIETARVGCLERAMAAINPTVVLGAVISAPAVTANLRPYLTAALVLEPKPSMAICDSTPRDLSSA